jgi:hypothetical protein
MIRTHKYKFIFNSPTSGELYDLHKDPNEMLNHISDPEYNSIKKELIELLLTEMKRLNDPLSGWFGRIKDVY